MPGRTVRLPAEQNVNLLKRDGDTDAGQCRVPRASINGCTCLYKWMTFENVCQCRVHHHGRYRQRRPAHPGEPEEDLKQAGAYGDRAGDRPAEFGDQARDDDRQAGCRTAHLERRSTERTGYHATDDGRDQTGQRRGTRRDGDPE